MLNYVIITIISYTVYDVLYAMYDIILFILSIIQLLNLCISSTIINVLLSYVGYK